MQSFSLYHDRIFYILDKRSQEIDEVTINGLIGDSKNLKRRDSLWRRYCRRRDLWMMKFNPIGCKVMKIGRSKRLSFVILVATFSRQVLMVVGDGFVTVAYLRY